MVFKEILFLFVMVETRQSIEAYRSNDNSFEDEIDSLNEQLRAVGINCEVLSKQDYDGETLIFRKVDL